MAITRARSQESSSEDGLEGENTTFDLKEDPSFWKENNIQVVIRVRPLNQNEISQQGYNKCIKQDSCQSVTWVGHPESRFTFDLVADEHVTQENLFKAAGIAMVDNCMEGYNSCMFAYGQTGSGKTHTMLGDIENGMRRHNTNCGMTPRVFEYLFHRIQKEKEVRKEEKVQFTCKCSFLEIYNEQIFDLLDPNSTNLQIREDLKKGVHVENLKEHEVTSATEAMQQLIQGAANRKVAATNMNRASSRSHSIFTCVIESKWEVQGIIRHRFARLNLVDLAGSERQKSSGAEGERLKEATNINKSLSTLGLVIMNLVGVSNKKSVHVPYRDSKLTFLLQDSLGGNSKTTIIANISPSNCSALETLSTLKFAQRAKFIKNNAIVNEDASGDVISMRLQIQQLKKELAQLRNNGAVKHENEVSNNSAFDSPCMLKLEGSRGNFSPLTFDKRLSQKKEFEVALVAAIRREKEKEASLKALDLAKRTAQDLAEQRENEIKGLKMMLKFREAGIKRLQAVSKDKLSSDSHLLSENEELKREIESLKCQLERNPAVTKFANENLQLKEQLIRLKAFVEEGERERMDEQITVLQDKLLEALDWKLMHEKDPFFGQGDAFNLEPSGNEENEFLQLQAIQNAREIESLKKKLNLALEENKNLHMRVAELSFELEREQYARISKKEEESKNLDAESELKTLVEAIANASQKEAEAHEKTIKLTKENEELKLQLGAILEDSRGGENEKLELQLHELRQENEELMVKYEDAMMEKEKLRLQIRAIEEDFRDKEMQAGYEEMMVKYENAMREKEDLRLQISAIGEDSRGEKEKLEAQLIELNQENEEIMSKYENAMRERDNFMRLVHEVEMRNEELVLELEERESRVPVNEEERETGTGFDGLKETVQTVGTKLALLQDKLSCTNTSINHLMLVEKACYEINELSRLVPVVKESVQPKLVQLAQYNNVTSHKIGKKNKLKTKISALVSELEISSSKISALMEKEDCIKTNINEVRRSIESKNEELRGLNARKEEIKDCYKRASENEIKLRGEIENLKPSLNNAENMKKEREVLLEVNQVNHGVKMMDMLKHEMDLNKLAAEMKNLRDQLVKVKKEISGLTKSKDEVELKVRSLEEEIRVDSLSLEESEREREKIMSEIERVELTGEGIKGKIESILPDYQEAVFELGLNLERIRVCEESVREEKKGLSELERKLNLVLERMRGLLVTGTGTGTGTGTVCVSEIVVKKIEEVQEILNEAKCLTLLEDMMVC